MIDDQRERGDGPVDRGWVTTPVVLAAVLGLATLGGCAGSHNCAKHVDSFGGTLLMEWGGTGLCRLPPCTVQIKMPAGSGSYEVFDDGKLLGQFPAGQRVTLGSFARPRTFVVNAAGVESARLFVQ